ncbi:tetratricopeptide repeat protein, partial [Escherichia coli]|uniref:tetratricopeptide repeat protein n=1 Tax=Escherichia coli TaxID=562 RepID=UPI0011678452
VVLLPDDPVEKRDRGLALAALGANAAAAADLAAYLAARGDAPDAGALLAAAVPLDNGLCTFSRPDMLVHAAAHLLADGDLAGGMRNLW